MVTSHPKVGLMCILYTASSTVNVNDDQFLCNMQGFGQLPVMFLLYIPCYCQYGTPFVMYTVLAIIR